MTRSLDIRAVRAALHDPVRAAAALDLTKGAKRSAGGCVVFCPTHDEKSPSCSITRGPDGTVRAKCFGCGWSADVIGLVGAVHRVDFPEALRIAAQLAGVQPDEHPAERRVAAARVPPAEPVYPDPSEVAFAWSCSDRIRQPDPYEPAELAYPEIVNYLERRALPTAVLEDADVVRVAAWGLPAWAENWPERGYALIARVFDSHGTARSLRGWRIDGGEPKRIAPKGYTTRGLVSADLGGAAMLRGDFAPDRVIICEGEPDLCSWAVRASDADENAVAVLGLTGPASWSQAIADRVPVGARVVIRTDGDAAGERYAGEIAASLKGRVELMRAAA